jgi:hypothetical protein
MDARKVESTCLTKEAKILLRINFSPHAPQLGAALNNCELDWVAVIIHGTIRIDIEKESSHIMECGAKDWAIHRQT